MRSFQPKNTPKVTRIKRIMVVDDDQINILVAKNYLKSFKDYNFDTANNGFDAIEKIKSSAPSGKYYDVILMDCNMPKLDSSIYYILLLMDMKLLK